MGHSRPCKKNLQGWMSKRLAWSCHPRAMEILHSEKNPLTTKEDGFSYFMIDGLVRSQKTSFSVIPAEAGIQEYQEVLDPGFRRGDGLEDFLRVRYDRSWLLFSFVWRLQENLNSTPGLSIDNKDLTAKPKGFYSNLSKKTLSSGIFFFFRISTHESTIAGDPQM
jgi:hypothetical protein